MPNFHSFLIGDLDRGRNFRALGSFWNRSGRFIIFPRAEAAVSALAAGEIVSDLTVIAQSYPGEFSQQAIDRLRAASPVSRMIALLGTLVRRRNAQRSAVADGHSHVLASRAWTASAGKSGGWPRAIVRVGACPSRPPKKNACWRRFRHVGQVSNLSGQIGNLSYKAV